MISPSPLAGAEREVAASSVSFDAGPSLCEEDEDVDEEFMLNQFDDPQTLCFTTPASASSTDARSPSNLSLDSSISTLVTDTSNPVTISAFCVANGLVLNLSYPTERNGWQYRFDIGSRSQHRWDFNNLLIMYVRTSDCKKQSVALPCRNCVMKSKWRRDCERPFYLWYVDTMYRTQAAIDELRDQTLTWCCPEQVTVDKYMSDLPKFSLKRKQKIACEWQHVMDLERRHTGFSYQTSPVEELVYKTDTSVLCNIVSEALAIHNCVDEPSGGAVDEPTSVSRADAPVPSSSEGRASPQVNGGLQAAYEAFLSSFSHKDTTGCIRMPHPALVSLLRSYSGVYVYYSGEVWSDALRALLGGRVTCRLMLKSVFATWIGRAISRSSSSADRTALISIGYYVAPESTVFLDIVRLPVLPLDFASCSHRVHASLAGVPIPPLVHPILVAVLSREPVVLSVDILPLSVIWCAKEV